MLIVDHVARDSRTKYTKYRDVRGEEIYVHSL